MPDLLALLADIEAAKTPSRELDARLLCALEAPEGSFVEQNKYSDKFCIFEAPVRMWLVVKERPTKREHDALALFDRLLSGADYQLIGGGNWCRFRIIASPPKAGDACVDASADRPDNHRAMAIVAAVIKALIAQGR